MLHKQNDFFLMPLPPYESVHIKHNVHVRKLIFTPENTSEKWKASQTKLTSLSFVPILQAACECYRQEETYQERVGGETEVI